MSSRILVIDDIEANRKLLKAKLESRYHVAIAARSGQEGLRLAREETPDIILLDVMMPGLDGYETCRRLKRDPATAHIPVVMITALSEIEDRVRGLQTGAEDFITKPFDDFALFSRIDALARYNTVARELRDRQASVEAMGAFDDAETAELNRPAHVLLIEPSPGMSRRMTDILEAAGHEVTTLADTGAMGETGSRGIDTVVMNLSGQHFDALKLCARFRMSGTTRALSVIVACEAHDREVAGEALRLGASDVILIPIEPPELIARVRTQTRRTRYIEIMRRRVDRGLELSVIDQLTGLHNRRFMMHQLRKWMQRGVTGNEPVSLVAMDIDHFKSVNDRFGHKAGDVVLGDVAGRLKANVRPMDIVCRSGGEEFIIIMPQTTPSLACAAAERVRRAVETAPFEVDGLDHALQVTLSAGVSTLTGPDDTPADIMDRADKALYAAKARGRNQVCEVAA